MSNPIGMWTALNDVEVNEVDGLMYWAILEYADGDGANSIKRITDYDLTNEQAWAVAWSHNEIYGFND